MDRCAMDFTFRYRLKNGKQVDVLAVIHGETLSLGCTTDATDTPEMLERIGNEFYAIADFAWELHEERTRARCEAV